MFLRSLVLSIALAVIVAGSAQAGWFTRSKPRTEESGHHHHGAAGNKAKAAKPTSASDYRGVMHKMHGTMRQPISGNVDVDFARQMIPHHQAALDMARIQQKYGRDAELKKFNDWVIMAQSVEIGYMKNWLRRRDHDTAIMPAHDYYGEAMKAMHKAMAIRYTGDADVDYVRGMIAHHQGAVDMAAILLAHGTDPDLNNLANDIYTSQNYEIAWMKRWLEARGHSYP